MRKLFQRFLFVSILSALTSVHGGCTKDKSKTEGGYVSPKSNVDKEGENQDQSSRDQKWDDKSKANDTADSADGPKVLIQTSMGDIVVQLNEKKAPITVKNFLRYVNEGFFDGTIFHRVISNFMIQGGGFTPDFKKKDTHEPIKNEADNGLENLRGTIAMARTPIVDSATAQFFINVKDNPNLNHKGPGRRFGYAVFGKVVEGMDVVEKIRNVPTGAGGPFAKDCPQETVLIKKVSLLSDSGEKEEKKEEAGEAKTETEKTETKKTETDKTETDKTETEKTETKKTEAGKSKAGKQG